MKNPATESSSKYTCNTLIQFTNRFSAFVLLLKCMHAHTHTKVYKIEFNFVRRKRRHRKTGIKSKCWLSVVYLRVSIICPSRLHFTVNAAEWFSIYKQSRVCANGFDSSNWTIFHIKNRVYPGRMDAHTTHTHKLHTLKSKQSNERWKHGKKNITLNTIEIWNRRTAKPINENWICFFF